MQMATGSRNTHPEKDSPSFFKVIRNPSSPHLSLPKAFVRSYHKKIPRNPTIVTETGDHSWKMKFVKIDDDYCFAHGWDKLANDVQFCSKDIVMFWLIDPTTFKVCILGANGCKKDLPFDKTNFADVHDDDDVVGGCDDDDDDDDDDDGPNKNLCFEKVFSSKTYRYYMSLPINFVRAAGLEYSQSVKLKDHGGKEWRLGMIAERCARTRYFITRGWAMFRRHHKLLDGDVCMFTFNKEEGVLYLTQLLRSSKHEVKIENDWSWAEKPCDGGCSGAKVKNEYESGSEMEGVKRKREMAPPEKPNRGGGVEGRSEQGTDRVFTTSRVIYF